MASNAKLSDFIASAEKYLIDNWPSGMWTLIPAAADASRPFDDSTITRWVSSQFVTFDVEQPRRAQEDWVTFDWRLLCFARVDDRLEAAEMADQLKDLLRSSSFSVTDRADGSSTVGYASCNEVSIVPPQMDERGVTLAVVDVQGWVTTA